MTQSLDRLSDVNLSSGELEQLRGLKNTVSEFDSQVVFIFHVNRNKTV